MMLSDKEIAAVDAKAQTFAQFARAILAAHTAKLLAGVEMPEPTIITDMDWCENEVYDIGDMQQYAAACAAQERLRIEEAAMAWVQSGGETNLLAAIRGESK